MTTTEFQSTPPRGGRLWVVQIAHTDVKFQSTPPRGGRPVVIQAKELADRVSIHAPAWGATDPGRDALPGI